MISPKCTQSSTHTKALACLFVSSIQNMKLKLINYSCLFSTCQSDVFNVLYFDFSCDLAILCRSMILFSPTHSLASFQRYWSAVKWSPYKVRGEPVCAKEKQCWPKASTAAAMCSSPLYLNPLIPPLSLPFCLHRAYISLHDTTLCTMWMMDFKSPVTKGLINLRKSWLLEG